MEVAVLSLFEWTGECPYWDARTQELSLVDACTSKGTSKFFRWNPLTKSLKTNELDQCCSFNIPCTDSRYSVVSNKNEVLKFDWEQANPNNRQLMFKVDADKPLNRFNDAKCDKQGFLIGGTMSDESSPGVVLNPKGGSLFKYKDGDTEAIAIDTGYDLSNGLDWNSNGDKMFFADSCARQIYLFDYFDDCISNKRVCIDFDDYKSVNLGLPDGMTMDALDRLWITCFWVGKVVQFDLEKGIILQEILLPTACTTSCCFGGPQLTDMYVTSSKFGVGNDPSKGIENAGSLFKIPGSIHKSRGLQMNYFKLK